MSLSLTLGFFFGLEAGQVQGLQACTVQPNAVCVRYWAEKEENLSSTIKDTWELTTSCMKELCPVSRNYNTFGT